MALHVVKRFFYFRLFCQGYSPRRLANWSGVSRIYAVAHFVGPPIVLVVSSKDVVVLCQEFIQLLEFSVG
jgi:hypothetical protein